MINAGTTNDGVNRAGLFSDPLPAVINQGVSNDPGLLVDRAQAVSDKITQEIEREFGRDIRFESLNRSQFLRLEQIRERARRPSIDDLLDAVRQHQRRSIGKMSSAYAVAKRTTFCPSDRSTR